METKEYYTLQRELAKLKDYCISTVPTLTKKLAIENCKTKEELEKLMKDYLNIPI